MLKDTISNQIICNIDDIKNINKVLSYAVSIEEERDDVAYGLPIEDETLFKQKINEFLKLKKIIESEVGDIF